MYVHGILNTNHNHDIFESRSVNFGWKSMCYAELHMLWCCSHMELLSLWECPQYASRLGSSIAGGIIISCCLSVLHLNVIFPKQKRQFLDSRVNWLDLSDQRWRSSWRLKTKRCFWPWPKNSDANYDKNSHKLEKMMMWCPFFFLQNVNILLHCDNRWLCPITTTQGQLSLL